jgi:hypothetical protein
MMTFFMRRPLAKGLRMHGCDGVGSTTIGREIKRDRRPAVRRRRATGAMTPMSRNFRNHNYWHNLAQP